MMQAVVGSVIANKPYNGGNAWVVLSWVLGLKQLGWRVHFVEQIERARCTDERGAPAPFTASTQYAYFKQVTEQFGLDATLLVQGSDETFGKTYDELQDVTNGADLLINITGHLTDTRLTGQIKRRVYLDLDPGFTQFWHAAGNGGARLAGHDFYFTVGENIGTSICAIPTGGIHWRTTRQPVLLQEWNVAPDACGAPFTTIASWRGPYGRLEYAGKTFGLKVHEFRKFLELPQRTGAPFEIALDINPADEKDLRALQTHGWHLVEPGLVACDPTSFRQYVQSSRAEFSAAQGVYVETSSGWFSDRTVRYLASGRPALVQDTGLAANYPVGEGLLTFRTLDEAIVGTQDIERSYASHCRAARAIALEYFDSDLVLTHLLAQVL